MSETPRSRLRWMKFWPGDWQRDAALRTCSLAARGLWMELICIAHEGEPYGHVTINGRAPTNRQIGNIVGLSERDTARLISELQDAGVFSTTDDGMIYSRRMVRDKAMRDTGVANGKKGGNPNLNTTDNSNDDPDITGGVNPPSNTLEAKRLEEEKKERTFASLTATQAPPTPDEPDIRTVLFSEGLTELRRVTGKPDGPSRALIGRMLRDCGDDAARVRTAIHEAADLRPADPVAWLTAAIRPKAPPNEPPLRRSRGERLLDELGLGEEHDHAFQTPLRSIQ